MNKLILLLVAVVSAQPTRDYNGNRIQPISTSKDLASVADKVRSRYKDADVGILDDPTDMRAKDAAPYRLAHPDPASKLGKNYLELLNDSNDVIRAASIMALGLLKEKRSVPALRTILRGLPSVKLDQYGQPLNGQSPDVTRKEFTFASVTAGALMTLGDCKSIPEIMKHDITAFTWQSLFAERCKAEARKPLESVAANGSDVEKMHARNALRVLYGAEQ